MLKKFSRIFIFFFFFLSIYNYVYAIGSVGVKPLKIEINPAPGETVPFQIEVYSLSNKDTPVKIELMKVVQKEDGGLDFTKISDSVSSIKNWIKLDKTDFIVKAGESVYVNGKVMIPRRARGLKIIAIMVEPGYEKKPKGISIRIRYAVLLILKIKGRPVFEKGEIEKVLFKTTKDGFPLIEAIFVNKSETDFKAYGRAMIIDKNGKIFGNAKLTTKYLERNRKNLSGEKKYIQRIFPKAKIRFYSIFKNPIPPGQYYALVNIKYDKKTAVKKIKFQWKGNPALILSQNKMWEVKPRNIIIKAPPGSTRIKSFIVLNKGSKPLKLILSIKDLAYNSKGEIEEKPLGSTPYSASNWITLNTNKLEIKPLLSKNVLLKIKVPENASSGEKYNQVVISEPNGKNKDHVKICILVKGKEKPQISAKILQFKALKNFKGIIQGFTVEIENNSSFSVLPEGTIKIKDAFGNVIQILKIKKREILPLSKAILNCKFNKKLMPGEYIAVVELNYGEKQRLTSSLKFKVK